MSDLDERQRDSNMPKSENMIQYAFRSYNDTRNIMESIKTTPKIYREVRQAIENYKETKQTRQTQNKSMPVVTAEDIRKEMYER